MQADAIPHDVCDDGEMTTIPKRGRLSDVPVPPSPSLMNAYELVTLARLIEGAQRKVVKKIEKKAEKGKASASTGDDADQVRLLTLDGLEEKLEEWLDFAFGVVNESGVLGTVREPGSPEYEAAKEKWLEDAWLPLEPVR